MATSSPEPPKPHSNEDSSGNESDTPGFERGARRHRRHTVDRDSERESHSESYSTDDEESNKDGVKMVEALRGKGKRRSSYDYNSGTMSGGFGDGRMGDFLWENPLVPGQYLGYVRNSQPPATPATSAALPPASRTAVTAKHASTVFGPRDKMDLKAVMEALNSKEGSQPCKGTLGQSHEDFTEDLRSNREEQAPLELRAEIEFSFKESAASEPSLTLSKSKATKSILRPPREKFPEDPLPIREGVAPLAKAREDGIPPDARWTKISRKLVNPEALDLGKERYEAREDFVIILRVLTKDEVQNYAELTQSIRAKREDTEAAEEAAEVEELEVKQRRYSNSRKRESHKNQINDRRRSSWLRGTDSDTDSDPDSADEQAPNSTGAQRMLGKEGGTVGDDGVYAELIENITEKVKHELIKHLRENESVVPQFDAPAIEKIIEEKVKEHFNLTIIKPDEHDTHESSRDDPSGIDIPSLVDSINHITLDFSSPVEKDQTLTGEDPLPQGRGSESTEIENEASPGPDEQGSSPNHIPRGIERIQSRSSSNKLSESYEEDNRSVTSQQSHASSLASITDSLFSLVSGSSMSSLAGPQEAVDRLISLLLADEEINSICTSALTTIAPDRFERNLRRSLKEFGVALRKEAETPQQRRASHFVQLRARNSAYMICNSITKQRTRQQTDIEFEYLLSEGSDSDRSDDEVDDLQQLESFVKSSKAIEILKENLRAFVYLQEITAASQVEKDDDNQAQIPRERLEVDTEQGMPRDSHHTILPGLERKHNQDQLLSPLGVELTASEMEHNLDTPTEMYTHPGRTREPRLPNRNIGGWVVQTMLSAIIKRPSPVADGKIRMTWKCKCGHTLTDDFVELQPSAVLQLERMLNHATDSFNTSKSSTFSGMAQTLSSGLQALLNILNLGVKTSETVLPLHETTDSIADHTNSESTNLPPESVYLLICYNEGRFATKLLQLDLTALHAESDRALFQILRSEYHKLTGTRLSWLSLKTLESIKFVHFEMYKSELVDVRKEDDVPPPEDVEYRYVPAPPELIPPVGSNYLMHIFQHPDCAEEEPICLSKFPKKLKERLKCLSGVRPGWGLQFIEGWDLKKIWIILFVFFGLGSLAMGVLWAVFEHSIQDAFSMAAYMVAFATVSVGTVQAILVM